MGYKPDEVKRLTLKEFDLAYTGFLEREEEKWDRVRHIMWATISYGGMGTKKPIQVKDVIQLHKDKRAAKKHIKSKFQALEFLRTFY